MNAPDLIEESEALHARVRAFAGAPTGAAGFDALALDIARYQARRSRRFARLVELHRSSLESVAAIPAVPAEAFRLSRVATHPAELDVARFVTSGTTESARGVHAFRTTRTYRELSLRFAELALFPESRAYTVVALAPLPTEPPSSSLGFMMGAFMQHFDGRALDGSEFVLASRERWLLGPQGLDLPGLRRATAVSSERGEPLVLLATSLALGALVDALGESPLPLPPGSAVMQTGGTKGQKRVLDPATLRARAAQALGIPERNVVSEYGMTELSSQLYEGSLIGSRIAAPANLFIPPAWLSVTPVDAATLAPIDGDGVGLARFVDLGNVDSAVAVLTRDRIRRVGAAIELLGREPTAESRGCSLSVEAWLESAEHAG